MNFLTNNETNETIQNHPTLSGPDNWFTSHDHYNEFIAAFKLSAQKKELKNYHFIMYAVLRNKDWTTGWTYPTNPGKQLEHQYKKATALFSLESEYLLSRILKPFAGTVTVEMLKSIVDQVKK